ncbi:fatty acid synthase [Trichonephila inaurata madagascariensis]|uniref:oleoyl-[acyl-carrier-protein] hydrolase n=1 Tax=Trichonephila inaurata madagascariensis TaxID=2747483 RepID=A0A8X6IW39_9ARAC|nr:fatty acid synthase [Trichonephila inaurata madagascariensis]
MNVSGHLFKWIIDFLSQRFLNIKYGSSRSGYGQTRQVLPQGSVLSPVLFNIMINDLLSFIDNAVPEINSLLYADDLILWSTGSDIPKLESTLNSALVTLANCSLENNFKVNTDKTYFELFTLSTEKHNINLVYNNNAILRTDCATYLRISLDSRLTWTKHIAKVVENATRVDVILNSLADDKFTASIRCIAKNGRFIEIGKYDLALDREIGLKMFLENITFHGVFLDQLLDPNPKAIQTMSDILNLVKNGIKTGVVQPLDRTVLDRNSIEEAFRYMSKGIHIGKVLLKIRDEEPEKRVVPKCLMIPAVPETQFYYNKVYIIIGGLGGFGMEVTKWIMRRGGKNIILTSRYGARTPYHHFCLKKWQKLGVNVQVSTLNVAIKSEAERLLKEASRIGPVGGIFNSAVVLKDAFMDSQTAQDYNEVCGPKASATKYLDELTRKLCPSLDYFVCFSSISCGKGNAGQTNYGYANSVMERVCEERRSAGLHGLAVQWGIIGEVGVVHRHMGEEAMIAGVMAQGVKSCLEALDTFCQQDCPVVSSYVTAEQIKKSVQGDAMAQIVKFLGIDESLASGSRCIGEIGIDSIIGVELQQMIEFYADISISIQEIQELTIDDIKAMFEKRDNENANSQTPALMATTSMKLPPSLTHEEPFIPIHKDAPGEPIFIVSMGDTDASHFQFLARALNRPLYALVWTKDTPSTDIESLASWYLKLIQNTIKGPFHIVGYSLGGNVAFEMALQSEKSLTSLKTVSLLSGSKDLINTLSNEDSQGKDSEVVALCRFVEQFASGSVPRLEDELSKIDNKEQRIRAVLDCLTKSSSETVNKNEVSEAISNYLIKHNIIKPYFPSTRLSKDINIIENSTKLLANDISEVKEIFSQVCTEKVLLHRIYYPNQFSNEKEAEQLVKVLQTIV